MSVAVSGEKLGSPDNPVHMAVTRSRGSTFRSELWGIMKTVIALLIVSFIFMSMLSSTVFNSVKNSSKSCALCVGSGVDYSRTSLLYPELIGTDLSLDR